MSDFSTQAMKPKEQPKTCGNCANVEAEIHTVKCPHKRYPMEKMVDWAGHPRFKHHINDSGCEHWTMRHNDTIEQRYQQLEEVAREMLKAIAPMHETCCEDTCRNLADMGWKDGCCYRGFREQLEALGVSVDD